MKQSRYTVVVEGANGEHLLYNTANGAFDAYGANEYANYVAFLEGGAAADDELAETFVSSGFLTDLSPEEELAAQKALFDAQREDHSELTLVLSPTYACNLRCPYCYEQGHNAIKGKMSPDVQDAIIRFVEERFAAHPFDRLCVQWYGGDPSLALDVVEELSARLIALCDERGSAYEAMMLTNCNVIDEAAVEMLARMRVTSVFITIDGLEDTHNARRVSAVGLNSFERNVEAAKLFVKHGIGVRANMNADRVNWPEYRPLRDMLRDEVGVDLTFSRLCDYGDFFGTRDFKKPAFDLFAHEEFCQLSHETFAEGNPDEQEIRAVLCPTARFCKGQRDDYFIIDTIGDVYLCDGYIGEQDHVVGNVIEGLSEAALHSVSHDPHESEQCRACELLPICQGNCDWERRETGMHCHPLRTTLPDYLRDLRAAQRA